ncbi:VOC family protein [Fodinicola feengrottensis]|uniref:VOC family protein n=1 Tax=Fodinicola feengrottensis TaxID=435914 RepID=A0ABN2G1F3_9ACTN
MTGFHFTDIPPVAISVRDQQRAVDFYVGVLGFQKRMDVPLGQLGGRWITVGPAESVAAISLVAATDHAPSGGDTGIRLAAADAAAAHRRLADRGVEVAELLKWDGIPPMFSFRDPDGNRLVIIEKPTR